MSEQGIERGQGRERRERFLPVRGTGAGMRPLAAVALLILAGCQKPADPPAVTPAPVAGSNAASGRIASDAPVKPAADRGESASAPLPSAAQVLGSIYQADARGADSFPIENGSVASFWYGDAFELGGKRYYTGFAYDTPEKYGNPEDASPAPDARVTLTQATFVLEATDTGAAWAVQGAERYVGEFGAYEKADDVDTGRKAQDETTPDGRRVLAVPTSSFTTGVTSSGFAIFVFDPRELTNTDDRHWTYLGTLTAGEDNGAACADGEVMPCVSSTGTLSFQPGRDGGMPILQVARSGTTIESPGKTRALGAADAVTYVFDAAKKQYVARAG